MPSGVVPKKIKYWVNSFNSTDCALFENLADLASGVVFESLVSAIFKSSVSIVPIADKGLNAKVRIHGILCFLMNHLGAKEIEMPRPIRTDIAACASLIAAGNEGVALLLLQFLHAIHSQQLDKEPISKPKQLTTVNLVESPLYTKQPMRSAHRDEERGVRLSLTTAGSSVSNVLWWMYASLGVQSCAALFIIRDGSIVPSTNCWQGIKKASWPLSKSSPIQQQHTERRRRNEEMSLSELMHGVLLSEVIAALVRDDKRRVKQVDRIDRIAVVRDKQQTTIDMTAGARENLPTTFRPRTLLVGTTPYVRSPAQALQNFRVCLSVIREVFPDICIGDSAHDLTADPTRVWRLMDQLKRAHEGRERRGRDTHRDRRVSFSRRRERNRSADAADARTTITTTSTSGHSVIITPKNVHHSQSQSPSPTRFHPVILPRSTAITPQTPLSAPPLSPCSVAFPVSPMGRRSAAAGVAEPRSGDLHLLKEHQQQIEGDGDTNGTASSTIVSAAVRRRRRVRLAGNKTSTAYKTTASTADTTTSAGATVDATTAAYAASSGDDKVLVESANRDIVTSFDTPKTRTTSQPRRKQHQTKECKQSKKSDEPELEKPVFTDELPGRRGPCLRRGDAIRYYDTNKKLAWRWDPPLLSTLKNLLTLVNDSCSSICSSESMDVDGSGRVIAIAKSLPRVANPQTTAATTAGDGHGFVGFTITDTQQAAVVAWLYGLGLSTRNGEGHLYLEELSSSATGAVAVGSATVEEFEGPQEYVATMGSGTHTLGVGEGHASDSAGGNDKQREGKNRAAAATYRGLGSALVVGASQPMELSRDRLRNGEMLCDLFCVLEPAVAAAVKLCNRIHRNPATLDRIQANISRSCFLFGIRASPPLPLSLLCASDEIMRGSRKELWGLLWAIMLAYSCTNTNITNEDAAGKGDGHVSLPPPATTNEQAEPCFDIYPSVPLLAV